MNIALDLARKAGRKYVKDTATGMLYTAAEPVIQAFCKPIFEQATKKTTAAVNIDVDTVVKSFDVFGLGQMKKECDNTADGGLMCAKAVLEGLSVFDPTEALAVAAAFMHPTCRKIPV